MARFIGRMFFTLAFLALTSAAARAATFNYSISCPQTIIGPVTVLAFSPSGSVTLAPYTASTVGLLPTNNITRVDNNAAAVGIYGGTLSCSLTFGGVTVNFARSLSLNVTNSASTGLMTTGATSFTVDLGAQGKVDFSVPSTVTVGYDGQLVNGGIIIVPIIVNTTLLLHDVPAPVGVPVSTTSLLLMFGGLGAMGLYATGVRRRHPATIASAAAWERRRETGADCPPGSGAAPGR